MGITKADKESSYTLKLPLLSASYGQMQSPERSGMLTPPFRASASVPFRWEEEPGKPKPCTTLIPFSNPQNQNCLQLPPCRFPPTTTHGVDTSNKARFKSSSFRTGRERDCYGSFPQKEKVFGSWRRALSARREGYVFPSSGDKDGEYSGEGGEESSNIGTANITGIRRVGSFSGLSTPSKPHLWVSIYQGIKQVVPWSKKIKKDGLAG